MKPSLFRVISVCKNTNSPHLNYSETKPSTDQPHSVLRSILGHFSQIMKELNNVTKELAALLNHEHLDHHFDNSTELSRQYDEVELVVSVLEQHNHVLPVEPAIYPMLLAVHWPSSSAMHQDSHLQSLPLVSDWTSVRYFLQQLSFLIQKSPHIVSNTSWMHRSTGANKSTAQPLKELGALNKTPAPSKISFVVTYVTTVGDRNLISIEIPLKIQDSFIFSD